MICKIGDRVRTTKSIHTKGFYEIETGHTGKIIDINENGRICVEFDNYINGHDGGRYSNVKGKDGYCWWVYSEEITIIKNNKIVITTDGNETLARLYDGNRVIKTATAKCSPADAFNFEIGAKIAFERLFEDKPAEDVKPPKFEVGERYAYNSGNRSVIIEIIGKDDNWYLWKTIEGMKHWCAWYKFQNGSDFANRLTHIEKPKYYNGKVVCIKSNDDDFTAGKVYEFVDGQTKDNEGDKRPTGEKITSLDYFKINYEFIPFVE